VNLWYQEDEVSATAVNARKFLQTSSYARFALHYNNGRVQHTLDVNSAADQAENYALMEVDKLVRFWMLVKLVCVSLRLRLVLQLIQ